LRTGRAVLLGVALGIAIGRFVGTGMDGTASARPSDQKESAPRDLDELARLYEEDQADRMPGGGKPIDWMVVLPRDRRRETRIKALYEAGSLRTGKDFYRAAMVLQHATRPEDYLLAHEFCVVALAKGNQEARWLAAATEDRFLMYTGRPQRFGTQYRSAGANQAIKLYEVGPGVTDALRRELGAPTLAEARQREAMMEDLVKGKKPAAPVAKP
jgi:hypothetical protein